MANQDKKLTCRDCGQEFLFTVNEQNFYAEKGFTNEPTRCKACRDAKKNSGGGRSARKEMFAATCAKCGKETQVPFKPSGDRPVYCSDCFSKQR